MTRFPACDAHYGTPCVFSEHGLRALWRKNPNVEFQRCPKHGALICTYMEAETIEEARKKMREEVRKYR